MLDPRTLLVYGMNGETLPVEHGFPLRIYIPNRYGMKQPKRTARGRARSRPSTTPIPTGPRAITRPRQRSDGTASLAGGGGQAVTSAPITGLFLDIGGVLLTNGWDRSMRARAAEQFRLDPTEMDERHHLTYDTYEARKLSLDEYLDRVVFYQDRSFSREEFKAFMFAQSRPYPEMIQLIRDLKARYRLKIAVISNEGRELAVHCIRQFALGAFVDFFIVSCFVHCRKPDPDIYRIALDIAQVPPTQVAYIEDRAMFVEVSRSLGFRSIHHTGYESARARLASLGLALKS